MIPPARIIVGRLGDHINPNLESTTSPPNDETRYPVAPSPQMSFDRL